jgi:hypothetical protein
LEIDSGWKDVCGQSKADVAECDASRHGGPDYAFQTA